MEEDLRRIRWELDKLCQQRVLGWTADDAERYQELCILERYLLEAA
jgi:hypothetical protein